MRGRWDMNEPVMAWESNFAATSCPSVAHTPKAENILKTKARRRRFSFAKADNIMIGKVLTRNYGKVETA